VSAEWRDQRWHDSVKGEVLHASIVAGACAAAALPDAAQRDFIARAQARLYRHGSTAFEPHFHLRLLPSFGRAAEGEPSAVLPEDGGARRNDRARLVRQHDLRTAREVRQHARVLAVQADSHWNGADVIRAELIGHRHRADADYRARQRRLRI